MAALFADQWQQEEFADVEVLLTVQQPSAESKAAKDLVLNRFPAHRVILGRSPYLKALMLRWQHKRPREPSPTGDTQPSKHKQQQQQQQQHDSKHEPDQQQQQQAAGAQDSGENAVGAASSTTRPQLVLTLQDACEQTAALAVLSSLYGVKPLTELLSELSQVQQLQAAVLADMWELPDISTAAVRLLSSAPKWTAAALQYFLQLPAIPRCFACLVGRVVMASQEDQQTPSERATRVLLSVLGDLEEVWSDAGLKEILLGLKLPVMTMLMSSDELKVASEDTVLYTVQQYCDRLEPREQQQQLAVDQLTPLIRCRHLSQPWLIAGATCTTVDAERVVIGKYRQHLTHVLSLRAAYPSGQLSSMSGDEVRKLLLPGCPESWCLPPRSLHTLDAVQLVWDVEVDAIRAAVTACCAAVEGSDPLDVVCQHSSPPLHGVTWSMTLCCEWSKDNDGGCDLSLFLAPTNLLPGMVVMCPKCQGEPGTFLRVTAVRPPELGGCRHIRPGKPWMFHATQQWGWGDFFDVGVMSGGWDEAAWAAQGWPTSGTITLKLTAESTLVERTR